MTFTCQDQESRRNYLSSACACPIWHVRSTSHSEFTELTGTKLKIERNARSRPTLDIFCTVYLSCNTLHLNVLNELSLALVKLLRTLLPETIANSSNFPTTGPNSTAVRNPTTLLQRLEDVLHGFGYESLPICVVGPRRSLSDMTKGAASDWPPGYTLLATTMLVCAFGTLHWPGIKVCALKLVHQETGSGRLHAGTAMFLELCDSMATEIEGARERGWSGLSEDALAYHYQKRLRDISETLYFPQVFAGISESHRNELEAVKSTLSDTSLELQNAQAKCKGLEAEKRTQSRKITSLQADCEVSDATTEGLREDVQAANKCVSRLEKEVLNLRTEIGNLKDDGARQQELVESLESQLRSANATRLENSQNAETARKQACLYEKEKTTTADKLERLEKRVKDLENELAVNAEELKSNRDKALHSGARVQELGNELDKHRKSIIELTEAKQALQTQLGETQQQLEERGREILELTTPLGQQLPRNQSLAGEMEMPAEDDSSALDESEQSRTGPVFLQSLDTRMRDIKEKHTNIVRWPLVNPINL
ncbi:hypothetical protein CYLTODRAFT_495327 [Cylindrobasidium torrendii FP15055 ss-10]|uniref:Uncharacterized protein n=1 Tax=Cylindrobasidium torrendii FP15055 ss-10 TaxID=1314674 RepID=A0A0D7AVI8_9AGAR|nr:hypothetical protein CYLTODRAFT_495327 [Cylindrobasidium torrendii FP15055 ss-10]